MLIMSPALQTLEAQLNLALDEVEAYRVKYNELEASTSVGGGSCLNERLQRIEHDISSMKADIATIKGNSSLVLGLCL